MKEITYIAKLFRRASGQSTALAGCCTASFLPSPKVLMVTELAAPVAPVAPVPQLPPNANDAPEPRYPLRDLVGRLQWTGDAVQAQREQRDAW
jgi:hypothetical protein